MGRPLSRPFGIEIQNPTGKCTLKYFPERESRTLSSGLSESDGAGGSTSRLHSFTSRLMESGARGWENMILNTLLGIGPVVDDEDESDEELLEDSDDELLAL